MRHWSLFSGWGWFDIASEMIWWTNVFHCEWDSFCQKILQHYWPETKTFTDIKQFDGKPFRWKIDILTGGFPCQPFSSAWKRKGTADNRYLRPEMLRVIKEIQPERVVWENVYGLISWNEWTIFDQVHIDLEREGYEVWAFVLPASGVNAPHRRYRVWFIAHSTCKWCPPQFSKTNSWQKATLHKMKKDISFEHFWYGCSQPATNTATIWLQTKAKKWKSKGWGFSQQNTNHYRQGWPSQSPLCCWDDGVPDKLDGITFSKRHKESIKLYGNAIVPQVAYQIFRAIECIKAGS